MEQVRIKAFQVVAREKAKQDKIFKRKKFFVHPSQIIYIALSTIPVILATLFCTYYLIHSGEHILRSAKEVPLVSVYTMRQTIHALENEGYTDDTRPKVEKLKNELGVLKESLENAYSDTLKGWNAIRLQIFVLLFCCLMLIGSLALLFSHRVAGPLFRIGKCIDLYAEGRDSGPVHLRKRDHYKDLAASLERLRVQLCKKGYLSPEKN